MCGIAGIFNYADPERLADRDLLVRMTRKLAHRGPDAEGFWFKDNIGLGHRRLSIVDLSPTGAQPMATDDETGWLTYNGEFYNHQEFRDRLSARGVRFRGTSDSETLLKLMEAEGPDALTETAGIFAFAWWDGRSQSLTLARDHMGVKQVYFHDDGRRIVFASEVKALLEDPTVPREPDSEAVNQYLHFHTALFERTFFRNIHVVRAAHYLRITRHGAITRRYWTLDGDGKPADRDTGRVKELQRELTEVVGRQLMADVPVGSFFSGGIDSCAIAAHATQAGKKPLCFGVHFTGQGVTDERPYQEAAAEALGLDLRLITMDGSTFPEDIARLMYHQDEPVIGSAMFPMSKVSELAARHVKVCLGGQAADELFGGYARYALGRPGQVLRSWFAGRQGVGAEAGPKQATPAQAQVGGNLARQFAEGGTLYRLAKNARHLAHWETSYFEHFAKVPQETWFRVLEAREFCSRERSRQMFHETVTRYESKDPVDKIMRWDVDTYLTGLFHQDDRMSMAASLESRVPFADPKLARFAFGTSADLKLRGGASKWILRQAVSGVLPPLVLNRRKVGFDTPALRWMTGPHAGFVRETLLSGRARQRGFWNAAEIEKLLANPGGAGWFDVLWKVLCIEVWATVFLDTASAGSAPRERVREILTTLHSAPQSEPTGIRKRIAAAAHVAQEFREMGFKGTFARGLWEIKTRSGLVRVPTTLPTPPPEFDFPGATGTRLPFTDPAAVAAAMQSRLSETQLNELRAQASAATRGRIVCYGKWTADYGNPIDWHRDPTNGHRWTADAHWSRVLSGGRGVDVKFTWEAARFPQAYSMARAATFCPESALDLSEAFASQVWGFLEHNPPPKGVHWFSGQEVALRMFSILFGYHVFSSAGLIRDDLRRALGKHIYSCGSHLAEHIAYARDSVYNNHLLSEALGLLVAGMFVPGPEARKWRADGLQILTEQADRQIYSDGAYIQQSHNYQRVAMQLYLFATALMRANGEAVPAEWLAAMERSLDFLTAHQNPEDGRLPNYGPNDGSRPMVLAFGDMTDFRPVLQALSVATRNERHYEPGPWDGMAVWFFGPDCLELPLRPPSRKSVSFAATGYHVLRGGSQANFAAFRCGTVLDRFSQIDMLHVDVWWRGQNVLVDGGSYRYNGAERWHNHFLRTESHNTVLVDGHDQMLHFRQFKTLFWTEAALLKFEDHADWAIVEGEHYGYRRTANCTHRRAVLFLKDDVWVVADTISGAGSGEATHAARLHWLAGAFPFEFDAANACLSLQTPRGEFCITVLDAAGSPLEGANVVAGQSDPPRGWQSRYYGEKEPVPSLAATVRAETPIAFVSILSAGKPVISVEDGIWNLALGNRLANFRIADGRFAEVAARDVTAGYETAPEIPA
jgi:asparagine synthase (glutamine-hydrolysing)